MITEFIQDGLRLRAYFSIGGSIYNLSMKEKYMEMIQSYLGDNGQEENANQNTTRLLPATPKPKDGVKRV